MFQNSGRASHWWFSVRILASQSGDRTHAWFIIESTAQGDSEGSLNYKVKGKFKDVVMWMITNEGAEKVAGEAMLALGM